MGISGITARKGEEYFLSRAKVPVNQWLGLRVGKSLHAFCDLARQTHRGAHHGRTRAPYPAWPSSSRAAHAVPPHPLRRCVAPPQCLCSLGSVRRRGPSDLGGGILREHCRQRGARRHGATSRGAPPWGAGAGGRLGIQPPSARLRIGNVWETNCLPPSRDGLLSSTNSCRASARRIGRNPVIIPSGSARHRSLSPCG
jgi:hypothetical protein